MPPYIKDAKIDAVAQRPASLHKIARTKAVGCALLHELEREQVLPTLVERGLAFNRALRVTAQPGNGQPADKPFIDSLHGDA